MKKIALIVLLAINLGSMAFAQKQKFVEVLYFHRTNRCHTCMTIDSTAKAFISKEYKKELASGEVTFTSTDFQVEKENALVKKYAINGPTLLIVHHNKTKETKFDLTDTGFSNSVSNPTKFKSELQAKIDEFFR